METNSKENINNRRDTEQMQMDNESEEDTKTPTETTKQLLKIQKERAKLRIKNLLIKHIDFGNDIQMLKDWRQGRSRESGEKVHGDK